MNDKFSINTHKLIFHPKRVTDWLDADDAWEKEKNIYPIYLEISPFGACNHRCTFCSYDYIGYKNIQLDGIILSKRIKEMASLGVKSVMFAGEGEPTLWKPLPDILKVCHDSKLDASLTTNATGFTKKNINSFVKHCKWIKVSINAGTKEVYSKVHQTTEEHFNKVLKNIEMAVKERNKHNYKCVIGTQMVLLPENKDTAIELAKTVKALGVNYLVIKPFTQGYQKLTTDYKDIDYSNMEYLENELNKLTTDSFNVIFRSNAMNHLLEDKMPYDKCLSTPFFWGYIMASGDVYGCFEYLGNDEFCYGNIHNNSFQDIWEGEKRKKGIQFVKEKLDISHCRKNCRMDEVNRYLWQLKNPGEHVNFI